MTHEEKNIGGRAEHPGSDEQKISEMLTGLKRVEAPKDFDFHLKARIANARPADYRRTSLFPIMKYAMPLALFLAVGAGILLVNSYDSELNNNLVSQPGVPGIASPAPVATAAPTVQPSTEILPDLPRDVTAENPEASRRSLIAEAPRSTSNRVVPGGGSRDFTPPGNSALKTLGIPKPALTPTGMSLNPKRLNEAFKLIEAEAEFESGSWVVRSVKANGIADQMGLKMGDRVKAIDGTPVGERTEFPAQFSVRTIQIQRGDAIVELGGKKPD
jgi:hypothetical protein